MSAAVGLYSNSATVVTFEEHDSELEPDLEEDVGRKSSSILQMEFCLSSLELLLLADEDAAFASAVSVLMMGHIERFVSDLSTFSLFEPVEKALNKTMDVFCAYLTRQATAQEATAEQARTATNLLVQLTLARGSLTAIVRLANALAEHPKLLTAEVANSLTKFSDVEAFPSQAKPLFHPAPGTVAYFSALWKKNVMPAVRKADDNPEVATQIMSEVEKGNGEAAEALIRDLLAKKTLSALRIPNLYQLKNSKKSTDFDEAMTSHKQLVEQVTSQQRSGDTVDGAEVLALVFSYVDLAARHLRDNSKKEQSEQLRVPVCIDADALVPLVDVLHKHCSEDLLASSDVHRKLCDVILRLLTLNMQSTTATRAKLPLHCSTKLQSVLIDIIGMDFVAHPQCGNLGNAAVNVFAAGRAFLLQSTDSKLGTLSILAKKLIALPKTKAGVNKEDEPVSKLLPAENKTLISLPLQTHSTQSGDNDVTGAKSVDDINGAISKIIDKLGDVLNRWPEAGWEGGEEFRRSVGRSLTAGPTADNPCVLARGLSDHHANQFVSGLQRTTLESVHGLQVEKDGERVIVYLRGTKHEPSTDGEPASAGGQPVSRITGVLSVPADGHLRSKCDIAMPTGGLYYLEVSLTPSSAPPSDDIPQGFGCHTMIGICTKSFNVEKNHDVRSAGSPISTQASADSPEKLSTLLFAPLSGTILSSNSHDAANDEAVTASLPTHPSSESVHASVVLSPGYRDCSDAAEGPLQPGEPGTIVNAGERRFQVRALSSGRLWWYDRLALLVQPNDNKHGQPNDNKHGQPTVTKTKCREEGRRLRGDGGWKVGDPLSDCFRTVVSVEFGDSGDSDQYFGLLPSDRLDSQFSYSDLRDSGITIKHGRSQAIIRGSGTEVKSLGTDWRLKGHTITLAYEPTEHKLCFWAGGADSITREPDSVITGLSDCRMSAAVGLYSNSATVVTFEEHEPEPDHRPDWFGDDWWKSTCSVSAGDCAGLLLDTIKGDLIAMKNGRPLGILFSGLQDDEWNWYVTARDPGVQLQIFGAIVDVIDDVACLLRPSPRTKRSPNARGMIEGMMAATLQEVAKPSSLDSFLLEPRSTQALGHLLDILADKTFSDDNEDAKAGSATVLPQSLVTSTLINSMRLLSEEPDPERIAQRSTVAHVAQLLATSSTPESTGTEHTGVWKRAVAVARARSEHISRAVALIDCVSKFVQQIFVTLRKPDQGYSPFDVLEKSKMAPLVNAAQALGLTIAKKRTAEGQSAAVALANLLAHTLRELQETVDTCPELMADPRHPAVMAATEMAVAQNCDFRTAAYYVYSFGGVDGADMDQAVAEYKASGSKACPAGYSVPVEKHWLNDVAFSMNHCFARCIETLCAGLKSSEGDFDISLFDNRCDKEAASMIIEHVDITTVKQRWHGFPSPVLAQIETIAIQAMIAHCGLLSEDMRSPEAQGTLLHIGKEVLKIKRTVQDMYRASAASDNQASWEDVGAGAIERARLILNYAGATAISSPVVIELCTEDYVFLWERENASSHHMCLHVDNLRRFIQSNVSENRVAHVLESRLKAVSEAAVGYEAAVSLLTAGSSCTVASQQTPAAQASAEPIVTPDVSTMLSGTVALTARPQTHPNIHMQLTYELQCADEFIFGTGKTDDRSFLAEIFIKFDVDLDGKLNKNEYKMYLDAIGCWGKTPFTGADFDCHGWPLECANLQCDPSAGVTWESFRDVLYGQFREGMLAADMKTMSIQTEFSIVGRVVDSTTDTATTVEWTELCGHTVSRWVKVQVNCASSDRTLAGTCTRLNEPTALTLAGKFNSSSLSGTDRALGSALGVVEEKDTNSPAKLLSLSASGISVPQRQYRFMLSLCSSFMELGQLAEQSVQTSSESLSEVVVNLFCLAPSEAVRIAAGRLVLSRLENGGSHFLAGSPTVRQIVQQASNKCRETSTSLHELQGEFVAALLLKLAEVSCSADDSVVLGDYVRLVLDALRAGDGLQDVRWMKAIHAACFSPDVKNALQINVNVDYLWAAVEAKTHSERQLTYEQINAVRLAALQLLMLVIEAKTDNLKSMFELILASSPEANVASTLAKYTSGGPETRTGSVTVRVNASLALRNLVCTDTEWSNLFCLSCNEAALSTMDSIAEIYTGNLSVQSIPIFPHLQVLGCIEVQGSGQPGDVSDSSTMAAVFATCVDSLQELLELVLLQASHKQASLGLHILQSRLLKVAFELSSHHSTSASSTTMLTARSISAVAALAAEPTVPKCIELVVDKLHCIYPLGTGADTTKTAQQMVLSAQGQESKPKETHGHTVMVATDPIEFPDRPLTPIDVPKDTLLVPLKPRNVVKAVGSQTDSYLSTGSLVVAAIDAERTLAIMLARLCVIFTLAKSSVAEYLSTDDVVAVLRRIVVGGQEVIQPQFQTYPTLRLASVEQAITSFCADPEKLSALMKICAAKVHNQVQMALSEQDQVTCDRRESKVATDTPSGLSKDDQIKQRKEAIQKVIDDLRGGADAPGFTAAGAGFVGANGYYAPCTIPNYSGAPPYSNGKLHMFRWQRRHWVISDLGSDRCNFEESRWLYAVRNSDSTPPLGSWEARTGSSPAPDLVKGSVVQQKESTIERSSVSAFNLWLVDVCMRLNRTATCQNDNDWMSQIAIDLFKIWACSGPAAKQTSLAVLARLPATALAMVSDRQPKLHMLLRNSLSRQWESTYNEEGGSAGEKFNVGDLVRVISDVQRARRQQDGFGGWDGDAMTPLCGTVGTVVSINDEVVVQHNGRSFTWNPASLTPAAGTADYTLLPAYLQALFDVSLKADVLLRPAPTSGKPQKETEHPRIVESLSRAGPLRVSTCKLGLEILQTSGDRTCAKVMRDLSHLSCKTACYFEVTVVDGGQEDVVAVGVTPAGLGESRMPGWDAGSVGWHGDDGGLYVENGSQETATSLAGPNARKFGAGDTIGCAVVSHIVGGNNSIIFTLNGELAGLQSQLRATGALQACVGLKYGARVILNLGQSPFLFPESEINGLQLVTLLDERTIDSRAAPQQQDQQLEAMSPHSPGQTSAAAVANTPEPEPQQDRDSLSSAPRSDYTRDAVLASLKEKISARALKMDIDNDHAGTEEGVPPEPVADQLDLRSRAAEGEEADSEMNRQLLAELETLLSSAEDDDIRSEIQKAIGELKGKLARTVTVEAAVQQTSIEGVPPKPTALQDEAIDTKLTELERRALRARAHLEQGKTLGPSTPAESASAVPIDAQLLNMGDGASVFHSREGSRVKLRGQRQAGWGAGWVHTKDGVAPGAVASWRVKLSEDSGGKVQVVGVVSDAKQEWHDYNFNSADFGWVAQSDKVWANGSGPDSYQRIFERGETVRLTLDRGAHILTIVGSHRTVTIVNLPVDGALYPAACILCEAQYVELLDFDCSSTPSRQEVATSEVADPVVELCTTVVELVSLLPTTSEETRAYVQGLIDANRRLLEKVHVEVFHKYDTEDAGVLSKNVVSEMMLDMGWLGKQLPHTAVKGSSQTRTELLLDAADKDYVGALVDAFGNASIEPRDFGLLCNHLMEAHVEQEITLSSKSATFMAPVYAAVEVGDLAQMECAVDQAVRAGVDLNTTSPDFNGCTVAFLCARAGHSSLLELLHRNGADIMRCSTADVTTVSTNKREDEGRRFSGDGTWKVGVPLSETSKTVLSVDFGSSGDSDQYLGLLPASKRGDRFGYSELRESGWAIKHDRTRAYLHGGSEVKSRTGEWSLKGRTITLAYEPKERRLCFWSGGVDAISRVPDSVIEGLPDVRVNAAVGLYSNSATVSTFEEHHTGPPDTSTPLWIACYHGFIDVVKMLIKALPEDQRWRSIEGTRPVSPGHDSQVVIHSRFGSTQGVVNDGKEFKTQRDHVAFSDKGFDDGASLHIMEVRVIEPTMGANNPIGVASQSYRPTARISDGNILMMPNRASCGNNVGILAAGEQAYSAQYGYAAGDTIAMVVDTRQQTIAYYKNSVKLCTIKGVQPDWRFVVAKFNHSAHFVLSQPGDINLAAFDIPEAPSTTVATVQESVAFAKGDIYEPDQDHSTEAAMESSWCEDGVIVGSDQEWPRYGTRKISQVPMAMFEHTTERVIQLERRADSVTPFFVACKQGHIECVHALFAAGIDAEATNDLGATPFHTACENGRIDVVRFLYGQDNPRTGKSLDVERGLTLNGEQLTPLAAAAKRRHHHVVAFLKEQSALRSYIDCRKLLDMPGLSMPPVSWWNERKPGWTGIPSTDELVALSDAEILQRGTSVGIDPDSMPVSPDGSPDKQALANLIVERMMSEDSGRDFVAAFSDSWTVQMDQALIHFASERALVKRVDSVSALQPEDLFDKEQSTEQEDGGTSSNSADHVALSRMVSAAPRISPRTHTDSLSMEIETVPFNTPAHLSDNSRGAIRARFMLLLEWNAVIEPALPLIDLRAHDGEIGESCLLLCQTKGRLLPDTKNKLIRALLKTLSCDSRRSVPRVELSIAAPGQEGSVDSVFEQIFAQLHRRHSLTHTEKRDSEEGQLWQVALRGEGTAAFTDTQDIGGHFRTSLRTMCEDLVSPSRRNGVASLPLFAHTTNFIRGTGDGEDAAELYLPNPQCVSEEDLERFRFVGVMCGASARFTAFMSLDLSSLCWKHLLGETISTQDLRASDAIIADLIESIDAIGDESTWALRQDEAYNVPIRWCVQLPGKTKALALRGDGTALVSFKDRGEYCSLVKEAWLSQFSSQLNALAEGFYSIFPEIGAKLLTWRELERRVCGLPDVDVSQLQRIARYEGNYHRGEDNDYIRLFWQVLQEFSGQERKQFLGFVWGRSRLPAQPSQPFTIDSGGGRTDSTLPMSHTCMFQLHLPHYSSKEILKARLLTAIQNAGTRSDSGGAASSNQQSADVEVAIPPSVSSTATYVLQPTSGCVGHREPLSDLCARTTIAMDHVLQLAGLRTEAHRSVNDAQLTPRAGSSSPQVMSKLDAVKVGAEAFFKWADKDNNGHISFVEACAVIDYLDPDLVGHDARLAMWESVSQGGLEELPGFPGFAMSLGPNREDLVALLGAIPLERWAKGSWQAAWGKIVEVSGAEQTSTGAYETSTEPTDTTERHTAELLQMDVGAVRKGLIDLERIPSDRVAAASDSADGSDLPLDSGAVLKKADVAQFVAQLTQVAWRWPENLLRYGQFCDRPGVVKSLAPSFTSSDEDSEDEETKVALADDRECGTESKPVEQPELLALRQEVEAMREYYRRQGVDIPGSWKTPERLLSWRVQSIGFLLENHPIPAFNGYYRNVSSDADARGDAVDTERGGEDSELSEQPATGSTDANPADLLARAVDRANQAIVHIEARREMLTHGDREAGQAEEFYAEVQAHTGSSWPELVESARRGTSVFAEFVDHMRAHGWQISVEQHAFLLCVSEVAEPSSDAETHEKLNEFFDEVKKVIGRRLFRRCGRYHDTDTVVWFVLKLCELQKELPSGVVPDFTRDDILAVTTLLTSLQEHDRQLVENIPELGFCDRSADDSGESEEFEDGEESIACLRVVLAGARLCTKEAINEARLKGSLSSLAGIGLNDEEVERLLGVVLVDPTQHSSVAPDSAGAVDGDRELTLQNAAGVYCYRRQSRWLLNLEHSTDSDVCQSYLEERNGANLLTGASTWMVSKVGAPQKTSSSSGGSIGSYKVVSSDGCLVRSGAEKTTEALDTLAFGEIIEVAQTVRLDSGVQLFFFARPDLELEGWVSACASDETPLLEMLPTDWERRSCTVTIPGTLEEAHMLEARFHDRNVADLASTVAAVQKDMAEAVAVVVSGCPHEDYNGEFQRFHEIGRRDGRAWPHYTNQRGKHLFYLEAAGEWVIHGEIVDCRSRVDVHCRVVGGLLPTGTTVWSCKLPSFLTTVRDDDASPPTEPPPTEDPPGLDRGSARSWCKRGVMARHQNGRVGEVIMDPDGDSEVKLRFDNGEVSRYVSIHSLEYVSQGAVSATGDRPTVGDRVRLREGWESVGDASGGPLRPGDEGIVQEDDGSGCPFHVTTESGRRWWYKAAAIEKVVARSASPVGSTDGASESTVASRSGPFTPPEQDTHATHAVTIEVLSAQDIEARDLCMLNAYSGQGDTCMLDVYRSAPTSRHDTCMLEFYTGIDQSVVKLYGINRSSPQKVAEIFGCYDADGDQKLNKIEYKQFLKAISYWDNNKDCTDDRYDEYGWPQECKVLECDPAEGISKWAFENKLYARCRKSQLASDLAAVRQHQAQLRGEAPATFDEQGELPPHWRTKVDPSRKKRYYYTYRAALEQSPSVESDEGTPDHQQPPVGVGRSSWVRPRAGELCQGSLRANVPPLVCMSGDGNVVIQESSIHFTGSFPTVGQTEDTVLSGVAFYEVRIVQTAGAVGQIGWATRGFTPHARHGDGVGDDDCSWGFDGNRVRKWAGGSGRSWGESWGEGDVIGIAANLHKGEIWFGRNGNWDAPMGCAFDGVSPDSGLFPALTGARGLKLQVNRGENPWAYGLPQCLENASRDESCQSEEGAGSHAATGP